MELVDRYLKSVRSCLPAAQRDDIISELSENLREQIEDREGELGRPLNESEVEALLKQHGHPLVVASRYGTTVILKECLLYTLIGLSVVGAYVASHELRQLFGRPGKGSGSAVDHKTGRA